MNTKSVITLWLWSTQIELYETTALQKRFNAERLVWNGDLQNRDRAGSVEIQLNVLSQNPCSCD